MLQRTTLFLLFLLLIVGITPAAASGESTSPAGTLPGVVIGMTDQPVGDVTISENAAGALAATATYSSIAGNSNLVESVYSNSTAVLRLLLPPGVTFTSTPSVSVASGNLQIGAVSCNQLPSNQGYLDIRINSSSTTPSVIKVSNILLTLDRTVPDGQITLKIQGTAVDQTMLPPGSLFTDQEQESSLFPNSENAESLPLADCVTAPPGQQTGATVFKVGEQNYSVNGTEEMLDTAPYIKDGRIMVPLRAVADAAGIPDNSIIWDPTGNVILDKSALVIKLVVGSKILLVNGAGITMDVAPEIVSGRMMLPVSWISHALGLNSHWDEAAQTVTITY